MGHWSSTGEWISGPVETSSISEAGGDPVQITGPNGAAATTAYAAILNTLVGLITNSRLMGANGTNSIPVDASNLEVDNVDAAVIGLFTNARMMAFDGTTFDRLLSDANKHLLIAMTSALPAGANLIGMVNVSTAAKGATSAGSVTSQPIDANRQGLDVLLNTDGKGTTPAGHPTSVQVDANTQASHVVAPTVGAHANAWNAATVAANGTSSSVDCQYSSQISAFGHASAATTIGLQFSQDNTNWYDADAGNIQAATLAAAGFFAISNSVGARYVRLVSTGAATITATIAAKS